MSQLNQTYESLEKIVSEARKKLNRKTRTEIIFSDLRHENSGRLICPFCHYTSEKNKTSAIIKNNCFKCFSCGKFGRLAE